jgi:hypothetical protein
MAPSAHGLRTVQPLHFLVEDTLIRDVPLARWNDALRRVVEAADILLCDEMKRAEKVSACDVNLRGAVRVTPFDRTLEDEMRRTWSDGTPPGALNQEALNFLFDNPDPSERGIYVVKRVISCGGERLEAEACTRVAVPVTAIALGGRLYSPHNNAVTLLHELGHQTGLEDRPNPGALMYGGAPWPRAGTLLNAAEAAHFRRLLPAS